MASEKPVTSDKKQGKSQILNFIDKLILYI